MELGSITQLSPKQPDPGYRELTPADAKALLCELTEAYRTMGQVAPILRAYYELHQRPSSCLCGLCVKTRQLVKVEG